jgi:hypothetical protein
MEFALNSIGPRHYVPIHNLCMKEEFLNLQNGLTNVGHNTSQLLRNIIQLLGCVLWDHVSGEDNYP